MAPRARLLRSRDAARLAARPRPNVLPRFVRPRDNPPAFLRGLQRLRQERFCPRRACRADAARDGCENRRVRSCWAHSVSKVERRERVPKHRKVRSIWCNVWSMVEIATLFPPTDGAHPASVILPSSVARLPRPIPELQASKSAKRIATRYTCSHCCRSSHDCRTSRSADSCFGVKSGR